MTRGLTPWLLALVALSATAQDAARLPATVTQIAGADAYLDIGRDDGVAAGDTLDVWRAGARLGPVLVVSAARASARVTPAAEPFALTRGEVVEIELPTREAAVDAPPEADPAVPERASILDAPAPRATRLRSPVRVTGRVQLGADALASTTTFGAVETTRQFATPFAALRADVTGLPGGWRARVNGRGQVRTLDGAVADDGVETRLYALDLEGDVAGARVRLGRFVPRHERFTGPWDGADLGVGGDDLGAGVVAGWRAARTAGLPTGDRPGALAYAHASRRGGPIRLYATASGGAVVSDGTLPFAGTSVSATHTAGDLRLRASGELLADARPGEAWDLARLGARLSVSPTRALTFRGYARQYRPSVADGTALAVAFLPSRAVGAGASARVGPATLRADLALRSAADRDWSQSVTGGVRLARLGALPLGLDAAATVWDRDGRRAVYASGGLTASIRSARATLGYRLTRSPAGDQTLTTHGLDASLHAPLARRLALSLRAGLADGDGLGHARVYSALWYRL